MAGVLKDESEVEIPDIQFCPQKQHDITVAYEKIIDYLFFRYYMICIKREEFPRFGATCILAEIVTMAYLFAVLILSFFLTGDFFCQILPEKKEL